MPLKRTGGEGATVPKRTRFAPPPDTASASASASASRAGPSTAAVTSGSNSNSADEDDTYLDADITEAARGSKKRAKAAVKDTSGYGSDSSDDEEGVVPSRRTGAKDEEAETAEDEEMDMFADEPEEPAPKDKGKGNGKEKEKEKGKGKDDEKREEDMDLDDVLQFQEPTHNADDDDYDSDSENEGKPKKTGLDGDMGALTPFNMKKEMAEGRFSKDGEEYVENDKDPHEKHDTWLTALDKEAIKKARRAHRERERLEKEREAREEAISGLGSEEREHALMRSAIGFMERGETVLEALQRLGVEEKKKEAARAASNKKKSWAERQKERKEHANEITPFAKLSEIVSDLTAIGTLDVYSLSRESMQRMLPRDPATEPAPPPPQQPQDTRAFQYRFSLAYMRSLPEAQRPVEREVFGPFSAQQLNAWKMTGFFGPECENVEVRVVKDEEQPWGAWKDVVG